MASRKHAPTSAPGELIGEYRVERVIGEGGMGGVYAAVHAVIDKRVALKVLRKELCSKPQFMQRFVQEARAVNRIGHPNIVDVFGFGTTQDGRAYLAMELLEGETVAARLRRGRLEVEEVCDIAIPVAHALEAAHAAGIIHRDLKPDNVFLAREQGRTVIKLLDFGIAKLVGETSTTQAGALLGTPTYMSPEQARGEAVDGRADIYALGVMLFEMLTGQPPFKADNSLVLASMHISESPPVPSTLTPGLSSIADDLIAAMLAKSPADRPSLTAVRARIEALRVDVGAGESGYMPVMHEPTGAFDDVRPTRALDAASAPRRWPFVLAGVLMLAVGFGAVVLLWPYVSG